MFPANTLPFLLLTHNLGKLNCIGPCFNTECPDGMVCIRGECCDEPFANTTLPPDKPPPELPDLSIPFEPDEFPPTSTNTPPLFPSTASTSTTTTTELPTETPPPFITELTTQTTTTTTTESPQPPEPPEAEIRRKTNRLITPVPTVPDIPLVSKKPDSTKCVDKSPVCRSMYHLCWNAIYQVIMTRQCMSTCGFCPFVVPLTVYWRPCRDTGNNCGMMGHLCRHNAYTSLLRRVCQRTCRFC